MKFLLATVFMFSTPALADFEAKASITCSYYEGEVPCEPGPTRAREDVLQAVEGYYCMGSTSFERTSNWRTSILRESDFPPPYEELIQVTRTESANFECIR